MKNLIVLCIVCLPLFTFAQVEQGRSFLSGGFGLSTNKPEDPQPGATKQFTRFDINAKYGLLFADTWAIGISPSYQTQTQTMTDNSKNHNNIFGIGPFIRKYFSLNDKFYLHLDAMYTYTAQKDFSEGSNGADGPITKSKSNVFAIMPGCSYFISDRVALTASIGKIAYTKTSADNSNNASGFDFNFSISSFTIGAAVYF